MNPYQNKIGYACMNQDVSDNSYKTCRASSLNPEKLRQLIQHNLQLLERTLLYNVEHKNFMFRVSSSLIPFGSSPLNTIDWATEFQTEFKALRQIIVDNKMRISVHPGQYTVINSPSEDVVSRSIDELTYHAKLLELLSSNQNHKMILHVGGVYDDKPLAIQRFIDVYLHRLSPLIKKYLVIENDDRLYHVEDILNISKATGVPVVFDNLHHQVHPSLGDKSVKQIIKEVVGTWTQEDGIPKMHYSQQDHGKRVGAHSKTIDLEEFSVDYKNFYAIFPTDIMLEVKDKNRSFIKVNLFLYPSQKGIEEEWARYKYWVMARSQNSYNTLRVLFKETKDVNPIDFYKIIDPLLESAFSPSSHINALQHAWGYFKTVATDGERKKYQILLTCEAHDDVSIKKLYRFIFQMANKYQSSYLLDSYFFDFILN